MDHGGEEGRVTSVRVRLQRTVNREAQQLAYNWQWVRAVGNPVVFQIEATNRCPMRCEMCPRTHAMSRPLGLMEDEVYRRVIDEACQSTGRVFLHHFGDSLLHPQLGEFVKYAEEHGVWTYLSANPALLTERRIRALVDNGLHELVLSLDGVTPDTSALVRGEAARDVELAEARIRDLLAYRRASGSRFPYVILQMVRQQQNAHEVDAWLAKWRAVDGVDQVKVKEYMNWNGSDEAVNALRPDDSPPRQEMVCDKPWTSVTVLWDGRVVPCCFDYDGVETLGNVRDQSLLSIWQGARLQELRRCHRDGDVSGVPLCSQCTDKEGYEVRKWYYPLNRLLGPQSPMGAQWRPEDAVNGR